VTEPPLDALTMDERIRRAAGRPVTCVEERVLDRALDRVVDERSGNEVLRTRRRGKLRTVPERVPVRPSSPKSDAGAASLAAELERVRARRPKRRRIGPSARERYDALHRIGVA
jgi:hypothetical protein